jgi:hypothetical protein
LECMVTRQLLLDAQPCNGVPPANHKAISTVRMKETFPSKVCTIDLPYVRYHDAWLDFLRVWYEIWPSSRMNQSSKFPREWTCEATRVTCSVQTVSHGCSRSVGPTVNLL